VAIVAHGLGQPEQGAIVALGLGATEVDPNALRATLSGSGAITADLTDGGAPAPVAAGSPHFRTSWVTPVLPQAPEPIPGRLEATLTGSGHLAAVIDFGIDADALAYELSLALLLDLV